HRAGGLPQDVPDQEVGVLGHLVGEREPDRDLLQLVVYRVDVGGELGLLAALGHHVGTATGTQPVVAHAPAGGGLVLQQVAQGDHSTAQRLVGDGLPGVGQVYAAGGDGSLAQRHVEPVRA